MNRRSLTCLAAIGAVLVAVLLLTRLDFAGEGSAGGLHAPGLADRLDDLASLRVLAAGNRVVATVQRGDLGWVLSEKGGHPVEFERFRGSLRALSQALRVERKTAMAEMYSRLGVEDVASPDAGGYLLELDYGDKHPAEGFIVGHRAGNELAYIRTAGEVQSWLVSADFDLSDETRDWVDRAVIDLSSRKVRRVVLDRGPGDLLKIAKEDSGDINFTPAEIPEGRELSYGSVANSIGSALANVEANDVLPAANVNDLPRAVLARYETFDGLVVELDVREEVPDTPAEDADAAAEDADPRYWVLFSAGAVDLPPASPTLESEDEPAAGAATDEQGEPEPGAGERAAELNARLAGWAYELPKYKSDQWFKKMPDLLKEE